MLVVPAPLTKLTPLGKVQVYEEAPATAAMLYVACVEVPRKAHTFKGPVMAAGIAGTDLVTDKVRVIGLPQPLTTTCTVPLLNVDGNRKLMEAVPCPVMLVQPEGNVHTYEVALLAEMVYVAKVPLLPWCGHELVGPEMVPAVVAELMVKANTLGVHPSW